MNKCTVKAINQNDATEFVFSGCIDETLLLHFDLFTVSQPITTIHLSDVSAINSTGIREWINLMSKLNTGRIKLVGCPKVFIDQVNMVKGFLAANASIESFYVPYFSEETNTEKKVLFEKNKQFADSFINYENTIVDAAGVSYEIDIIPSKYFKFIKA